MDHPTRKISWILREPDVVPGGGKALRRDRTARATWHCQARGPSALLPTVSTPVKAAQGLTGTASAELATDRPRPAARAVSSSWQLWLEKGRKVPQVKAP